MVTLVPSQLDITLPAGDSATMEVTVRNADLTVYDLTGATLKWSSQLPPDGTNRVDLTVGSGLTVINALNGRVNVNIPVGDITAIGIHVHELEVISGSESQTVLQGKITVIDTLNPTT